MLKRLTALVVCLVFVFSSALADVFTLPTALKVIGDRAFYNNTSMTEVVIPEGATSIGEEAFANSTVTKVTIPSTVTTIGADAFANSDLTEIVFTGDSEQWEALDIAEGAIPVGTEVSATDRDFMYGQADVVVTFSKTEVNSLERFEVEVTGLQNDDEYEQHVTVHFINATDPSKNFDEHYYEGKWQRFIAQQQDGEYTLIAEVCTWDDDSESEIVVPGLTVSVPATMIIHSAGAAPTIHMIDYSVDVDALTLTVNYELSETLPEGTRIIAYGWAPCDDDYQGPEVYVYPAVDDTSVTLSFAELENWELTRVEDIWFTMWAEGYDSGFEFTDIGEYSTIEEYILLPVSFKAT